QDECAGTVGNRASVAQRAVLRVEWELCKACGRGVGSHLIHRASAAYQQAVECRYQFHDGESAITWKLNPAIYPVGIEIAGIAVPNSRWIVVIEEEYAVGEDGACKTIHRRRIL